VRGPPFFHLYFTSFKGYFQSRDEGDSRCCGNDKVEFTPAEAGAGMTKNMRE